MTGKINHLTLVEVRDRMRSGELAPAVVLRECMSRASDGQGELNAFISLREIVEDAAADLMIPLGGIPLAVKDLIDVRGLPTTAASRVLADALPAEADAECVRRLKAAGAIIIGKTNLHEFAYGGSGAISAYGVARNPLDRRRVCGGSSSGSAAAVAAGMCFGALGTDTAGSIRLPAACCGVVGFKPTWGAVPVAGVIPLAWSYDHVGPLARTVEDAGEIFAVLAGVEPQWTEVKGLRCGVARKYFCDGLAPEVEAGFERALDAARDLGWDLHEVEIEASEGRRVSNAESWAYHRQWVADREALYDPRTLARIVNGREATVEEYIEARRRLELMRERCRRGIEGVDVVLTPTSPILPPMVEDFETPRARELELMVLRNTRPFNALGWPAISIPCAYAEGDMGRMVGVQIAAGWGLDWPLLSSARALERRLRNVNLPKIG